MNGIKDSFARIRSSFLSGDYSLALQLCSALEDRFTEDKHPSQAHMYRALLNEKARILRNLGRLQDSLECYVEALRNASSHGADFDIAWQLILLGKLFGKYLQRQMLFSAFLREGELRFRLLLDSTELDSDALRLLTRRYAIVQDLLGSYYRRLAEWNPAYWDDCEASYLESLHSHEQVQNTDGIARATCHLAYARALRASSERFTEVERIKRLREALLLFESGYETLLQEPAAQRGRATRMAQQAHIYLMLRRPDTALLFLRNALRMAKDSNDPRARLLTQRLLGLAYRELGAPVEAAAELEEAWSFANENGFGFQRQILSDLAEVYFALDEPQRATERLDQYEDLISKELNESNAGVTTALSVFRHVAPERAENYLLEGQQQDYSLLIHDLSRSSRLLRQLISRYERAKSIRLQVAIHQFDHTALRHALKNDCLKIIVFIKVVQRRFRDSGVPDGEIHRLLEPAQQAMDHIQQVLQGSPSIETPDRVSLIAILQNLVHEYLPQERVQIQLDHDLLVRDLMPSLLQEAFRHLIENIMPAIEKAPPPDPMIPYLVLRHEWHDDGGASLLLLNPGSNPKEPPSSDEFQGMAHGFQNARLLLNLLKFQCTFELAYDGPRTPPYLSNCVRVRTPPRDPSASWTWIRRLSFLP